MDNYREILVSLAIRIVIGAPLLVVGWVMLGRAQAGGGALQVYALGLFACAGIISGAVILAFPLARLLAEPCGSLFYPVKRRSRPVPMYSIPESKRARGEYEEAMAGFEAIAEDYPEERRPYIEMIDIAIMNLQDPERANEIYRRGMACLTNDDDKQALATMYSAIRSRLGAKPSN